MFWCSARRGPLTCGQRGCHQSSPSTIPPCRVLTELNSPRTGDYGALRPQSAEHAWPKYSCPQNLGGAGWRGDLSMSCVPWVTVVFKASGSWGWWAHGQGRGSWEWCHHVFGGVWGEIRELNVGRCGGRACVCVLGVSQLLQRWCGVRAIGEHRDNSGGRKKRSARVSQRGAFLEITHQNPIFFL